MYLNFELKDRDCNYSPIYLYLENVSKIITTYVTGDTDFLLHYFRDSFISDIAVECSAFPVSS